MFEEQDPLHDHHPGKKIGGINDHVAAGYIAADVRSASPGTVL
jgi:hypothetical protein